MKKAISIILIITFTCASFFAAQRLLMPKYMSKPFEGALAAEYYRASHGNDIIFIGDCEAYENISPVTLWEGFGLPSYIRGTAKQLMWQSRAILEDTLRHETPKVVVLSVLCMMYGEPPHDIEPYNRMTRAGLPLSRAKLRAVNQSVLPGEEKLSYLFPLLRFHERWSELTRGDLAYYFKAKPVSVNGFVMRADVLPAGRLPAPRILPDYEFTPLARESLDAIRALCEEKNIQLVLLKAPSLVPHWYDEWDQQITGYAARHNLEYLNALALRDEIGLNFEEDTYDAGLHLNLRGAEKLSRYLGAWLLARCPALADRRGDPALAHEWKIKSAQYAAWKAAQEKEIAAHNEVRSIMLYQTQ